MEINNSDTQLRAKYNIYIYIALDLEVMLFQIDRLVPPIL